MSIYSPSPSVSNLVVPPPLLLLNPEYPWQTIFSSEVELRFLPIDVIPFTLNPASLHRRDYCNLLSWFEVRGHLLGHLLGNQGNAFNIRRIAFKTKTFLLWIKWLGTECSSVMMMTPEECCSYLWRLGNFYSGSAIARALWRGVRQIPNCIH